MDRLDGFRSPTDEESIARRAADEALKTDERFSRLAILIEAETRNESPLGYLLASAHSAAVDAIMELVDADATKVDNILLLQAEVKRYRDLVSWLIQAVSSGREIYRNTHPEIRKAWDDALVGNGQDV